MPKQKRYVGTVGVYLLRHGSDETWETLVHRRSEKVGSSQNLIATPGGLVDRADCVNPDWVMDLEHGFSRAMLRETYEETGINVEGIDPDNIFELEQLTGSKTSHRNYLIYLNASLSYAAPLLEHEWEMTRGGVRDIGDMCMSVFFVAFILGFSKISEISKAQQSCVPATALGA